MEGDARLKRNNFIVRLKYGCFSTGIQPCPSDKLVIGGFQISCSHYTTLSPLPNQWRVQSVPRAFVCLYSHQDLWETSTERGHVLIQAGFITIYTLFHVTVCWTFAVQSMAHFLSNQRSGQICILFLNLWISQFYHFQFSTFACRL